MAQQINFYKPELRPKPDHLTLSNMAKAAGVFLLLMVAWSVSLQMQTSGLSKQREELVRNAQAEQAKTIEMANRFPPPKPDAGLPQRIAQLEAKLAQRQKVIDIINGGGLSATGGFSGLMQAFARQGLPGVWLTGLAANGAGDQMRISGRAVAPDLIPQYISRLSTEPALRGRHFSGLQVMEPASEAKPADAKTTAAAGPVKPAELVFVEFTLSADKEKVPQTPAGQPQSGGRP